MSFPEAIAFCALMLAIICVAGILLDWHNRKLKHRERELELKVRLAEAEGRSRVAGLPQVEERLRVLERIATDRDDSLASEIERLRDAAPIKENAL